jgi:hypothetical protein
MAGFQVSINGWFWVSTEGPFTWDQVGRMLMAFEGFSLRAFVGDSIEVIGGPLLEKDE